MSLPAGRRKSAGSSSLRTSGPCRAWKRNRSGIPPHRRSFLSLEPGSFFRDLQQRGFYPGDGGDIKREAPDAFICELCRVAGRVYPAGHLGGAAVLQFYRRPHIDAVGFNCMSGPYHLLQYIRKLSGGQAPVRNAQRQLPHRPNNRTFYGNNASYFSSQMAEIVRQGAEIMRVLRNHAGVISRKPPSGCKAASARTGIRLQPNRQRSRSRKRFCRPTGCWKSSKRGRLSSPWSWTRPWTRTSVRLWRAPGI